MALLDHRLPVCVDLDGVLASWGEPRGADGIGMPIPGAVEFTKKLGEKYRVVIHSCRTSSFVMGEHFAELQATVKAWLDRHGMHYEDIHVDQGKPYAIAYVDDRAVFCPADHNGESAYSHSLAAVDLLASQ